MTHCCMIVGLILVKVAAPMVAGPAAAGHVHKHDKHEASPKKSLTAENTIPTPAGTAVPVEILKQDTAQHVAKDETKKERSQSRKRASVFGIFGKKDEHDKEVEKEKKAEHKVEEKHIKEEKKVEKEHLKEEKKVEAQHKKEDAKAEHDAAKAKEAAEAAAVAAGTLSDVDEISDSADRFTVPAAAITAADKKDEKSVENGASSHDKKAKRNSVFGGLFAKLHSPTTEKTESEVGPIAPAKDHAATPVAPAVAPMVPETTHAKPVEMAAVTTPVVAGAPGPAITATPVAPATVSPSAPTTTATTVPTTSTAAPTPAVAAATTPATTTTSAAEPVLTPKTEKKHFLAGLMKKSEKSEKKEEPVTATEMPKETVVAERATETSTTTETTPVVATEAAKDERTPREKRRTSFFGSLGTLKRKGEKSPAPENTATTTAAATTDVSAPETKREKSPLPSKLGGLFRKPSKAVKSETEAASSNGVSSATKSAPVTNGDSGIPLALTEQRESKLVGDVIPVDLHATVHDAVTQDAPIAAATAIKKAAITA